MDRHEAPQTALIIALLGGPYLTIKMDRHERIQNALKIALLGGIYLAFKWTAMKGTIQTLL
jgi:hypothetical protein